MTVDITARRTVGRTGLSVTSVSLGSAPLGNLFQPVSDEAARATLQAAWDAGIRLFDTAPYYGHGRSERRIGDFLRGQDRDGYVLCSKVGRLLTPLRGRPMPDCGFADPLPFVPEYDYGYDAVMRSFEDSLQRLGLDRIDILLGHDIGRMTHGDAHEAHFRTFMSGGLRALAELKASGAIRAYGLGVNETEVCEAVLRDADLDCILLAGRFSLLDHKGALPLLETCTRRGVSILAGGVFNSGILATGPVPGARFNYEEAPPAVMERARRLQEVCARHGVPLPTAALHFPLSHPAVASLLIGVADPELLHRNTAGLRAEVPVALWADLMEAGLLDVPVTA